MNVRQEWFDDVHGTRTGIATDYCETTLGFDYHPTKCLTSVPRFAATSLTTRCGTMARTRVN